ncbi:retropepsin-like aspartic protease [Kineococcus sp. LSe6-4]|uniref:Retropepsin-like aspartic protease n=1 Tax=Kineococcus halophytocola TaxID=3234027 RepID=A0ABV4GVL1_9ACTN
MSTPRFRPPARTPAPWRRRSLAAALVLTAGLSSGCSFTLRGDDPPPPATGSAAVPAGTTTVDLQVLQQGPATLALVPVTIAGQGPFPFVLDTGASSSAVNSGLVQQLGLEPTGGSADVSGVTGTQQVQLVTVPDWAVGDTALPAGAVGAIDFPSPGGEGGGGAPEIAGLLGSDVLSTFGSITVDYVAEELRFTR